MLNILDNLSLPSSFIQAIAELMEVAEVIFGAKTGEQKKAWVKNAALDLAAKIDIPVLPEAIERPLEELVIDMVIEVLWAMLFNDEGQLELAAPEPVMVPVFRNPTGNARRMFPGLRERRLAARQG